MSSWSARNDGFVGPAQLQRLAPPPTRDFRRPPPLPPYHHHPAQGQQPPFPELAQPKPQAKARNSFFAAFRSIGNVNMPLEPRTRRVSEQGQQQPAKDISPPQRLQPRTQYSLPPSTSAPVLGVHTLPLQQLPSAPPGQPRSTMERTTSSSRQASGALSDHGHGSAGTTGAVGTGIGIGTGMGVSVERAGGGGGTINAGSFAAMREDRRRASMVDLPLQGGGEGERLPTVQESPRIGDMQQQQQQPSRLSQSFSGPQQQQQSRLSQSFSGPQQQQQQQQQQQPSRLSQSQSQPQMQVPQQQQQQQQPTTPSRLSQSQGGDRTSQDLSTSSSSAHFTGTPPAGGPLASLHPELRSGISLSIAHAHKVYFSGPLARRLELEPSGRPPHRQEGWVDVWAQLGGTTLSVWEMRAIEEASQRGDEVPPSYINVTDAFIGVLGSIEIPASGSQPASKRTNILTLNTAGSNLLLFSAPSGQALVSWAAALRLATWEKSRLEEIYTGHLLRMSLTTPNGEFKQPKTALTRGRLEGWVRIRLAGQVDWKRVYAIITSAYDPLQSPNLPGSAKSATSPAFAHAISASAPHLSQSTGRPESPTSTKSPSVLTKRRMSGIFRSSGGGSQNGGHGSAGMFGPHGHAKGLVDGVAPPVIAFHAAPPQGRKPKPALLTLTHVTQAFALYPERPEMISKSNLFKVEALLGTEVDYTSANSPEKSGAKNKGAKVEERFAGKMAGREGWCIVQPEVGEEPNGQKASLVMDMLKWLVAIHDAFGLYGRPAGYTWDPREPTSMMFSYPVGPMRDHLFLDRELAEALDPNDDSTSSVRARLLNILLERMRGPPNAGSVSGHSATIEEEEPDSAESPQSQPAAATSSVPELPPLEFGSTGYDSGYPSELGQLREGNVPPGTYGQGVHRTHSVLTKITEQSTVRGDSGDTETQANSGGTDGPERDRSLSRRSAFTEDVDEEHEFTSHGDGSVEDEESGEDHTIHGAAAADRESASSEPTIIAGASVVRSPEAVDDKVQPPASPYAVAHAEVRAGSPYAASTHSAPRSQRSGSPYSLPSIGQQQRAGSPYAVPSIAAAVAPRAGSPLATPSMPAPAPRAGSPYATPVLQNPAAGRAPSPYAIPTPRIPSTSARAASPYAVSAAAGATPFHTAPLPRTPGSITGNGHQEPKDYGFPPIVDGQKAVDTTALGQAMLSPRQLPLPTSPSPGLAAPTADARAISPGLAPPKRVSTTPPPQSPKLRAPLLESPTHARSPLGPPPQAPAMSPSTLAGPPPMPHNQAQHRMTPDKLPSLQTTGLRTQPPVPPAQEKILLPPPEYPAETPFTDSPVQSDSPEPEYAHLPVAPQPLMVLPTLRDLPDFSQTTSGRTSPASQYAPTEATPTPHEQHTLAEIPPFRRQQTPIAFDRTGSQGSQGHVGAGGGAGHLAGEGGKQNATLGRKPSGARAIPARLGRNSTSPAPAPQLAAATTDHAPPHAPAQAAPDPPRPRDLPARPPVAMPPSQPAQARPPTMARQQSTRDSLGDFGDDALAALSYMQLDGSPVQRRLPEQPQQPQPQPQQQQQQVTPPRASGSAGARSPPQSPGKDNVVYPSSFAASKQAAERKAKVAEQQQRRDDAVHKPGRPALSQRLAAAARGTWDRSSDEEEEEDDEEDDASEEEILPRGRQTSARPPPRDISLPSSQIHAPLPQAVNTPSHRFEIEAPSPPQQARMNALPADPALRQSSYSLAGARPGSRGSPRGAMGAERAASGAYDQQQQQQARMRQSGYPFPVVEEQRAQSQTRSRDRYDSQERAPLGGPNRQSVWTANLERDDAMPIVPVNSGNRNTFISLEPNETMTKAFTPHGLLQAGLQEKHDRSAKRQEEIARETGASLINVPSKPPPPQTGLLGAITAHERERNREGGMGATLTEREREKRVAEERQRRLDEYQRAQLDQAEQAMGQGGQFDMYGQPGAQAFGGFNPMGSPGMLHPMMTGMGGMMPNPMMMGGYGMNPMMYGMGGMMPYGGWGGAGGITPQQQQMAAQAAMEAYNRTMIAYSQVGSTPQSPAASEAGIPRAPGPNGNGTANPNGSNSALNRMSTASPPMSPSQWNMGMNGMAGMGMGGMGGLGGMGGMGMPGMGMMGMMSPQMMGMMGMPGGGMNGMNGMGQMGSMSPMGGMNNMGGMSPMGMPQMPMGSMSNLSGMGSPAFSTQQPQSLPQSQGASPDFLASRARYSSFTASDPPQSRPISAQNTPVRSSGADTPSHQP